MEEREFYDVVGKSRGWTFADLKVESEPMPFDYFVEVGGAVGASTRWLDLGCGSCAGLETIIPLCAAFVGVDRSAFMLEKAAEALARSSTAGVFRKMDTLNLDPAVLGRFDLVTARHAPFDPATVAACLAQRRDHHGPVRQAVSQPWLYGGAPRSVRGGGVLPD
jgi:SAM-dependent methyltransferase